MGSEAEVGEIEQEALCRDCHAVALPFLVMVQSVTPEVLQETVTGLGTRVPLALYEPFTMVPLAFLLIFTRFGVAVMVAESAGSAGGPPALQAVEETVPSLQLVVSTEPVLVCPQELAVEEVQRREVVLQVTGTAHEFELRLHVPLLQE